MEKFEVTILGCGSAKPSTRHFPSAQIVNVRDRLFLVDCGEGTQIQMCRNRIRFARMDNIFISHLHGDHCLGLTGLLSTLDLLGRTADLNVFAPPQFEKILYDEIDFFSRGMNYKVIFHAVDTEKHELLYDSKALSVYSIPLSHRIPCAGFLFAEKPALPHIRKEMIERYNIPFHVIKSIKEGADWTAPDGTTVKSEQLTTPADKPRRYAYCSDTAYTPQLKEYLTDIDLLYHEATYGNDFATLAAERYHSTARQAATLASESRVKKLVIGHFSSRYDDETILLDEARKIFPDTILAHENLVIKV